MNGDPKPHYTSSKKGTKSLLTSRPSVNSFCIGGSVGEARGARPQLTFRPNWSSQGKAKSLFNKEYVAFSWKNWKFWLENQMLRTILFAGSFSCSICLIYPADWFVCFAVDCSPTTLNFIPSCLWSRFHPGWLVSRLRGYFLSVSG